MNRLELAPDGRALFVGCGNGSIAVVNLDTCGLRWRFDDSRRGPVRSLACSPDWRTLAVGYQDQAIRLWDITYLVRQPAAVAGTGARGISPWQVIRDLARPQEREAVLRGHRMTPWALAFSPDAKVLASVSLDNTIVLWDVATGRRRATLKGHRGSVLDARFSPDGAVLATGGHDRTIKVWEIAHDPDPEILDAHAGGVEALAFSPDGRTLISAGRDQTIKSWDVASGRLLRSLATRGQFARSLTFTGPGGTILAAGLSGVKLRLWDFPAATLRAEIPIGPNVSFTQIVAPSPDGKLLVTSRLGGDVVILEVATGRVVATLPSRGPDVKSLGFSPDGSLLAAGNWDDGVNLYDTPTWRHRAHLHHDEHPEMFGPLPFAPDGSSLAVGLADGTTTVWDLTTLRPRTVLRIHGGQVLGAAFSPDGRTLATASRDRTVKLWDAETGEIKSTLSGHDENLYAVAFSPDGTVLASASLDGTVRLWRAPRGPSPRATGSAQPPNEVSARV